MTPSTPPYELFDRLFESTRDKLYSFVFKHTRDRHRSEDILQHCYMKLWENISEVDIARVDRLLFTYARHAIIDQVRRQQAAVVSFEAVQPDRREEALPADEALVYKEMGRQVHQLIDQLPPKRKEVFVLVREEGMSYEEVAKRLGISKLTIKKHMNEALRFLRKEATSVDGQLYTYLSLYLFFTLQP